MPTQVDVQIDGKTYKDWVCKDSSNSNFEGKSLCVLQNKATCKGNCIKSTSSDLNGDEVDTYDCDMDCKYAYKKVTLAPPESIITFNSNGGKAKIDVTPETFFQNVKKA